MKPGIHPTYYEDAIVICACGNTWTTGSTKKEIHTDVCSNCHPFYTGEQRIVDTAGQVERFMKRQAAKEQFAAKPAPSVEEKPAKKEKRPRVRGDMRSGIRATRTVETEAEAESEPSAVMFEATPAGLVMEPVEVEEVQAPELKIEEPASTEAVEMFEASPINLEATLVSAEPVYSSAVPVSESAAPVSEGARESEMRTPAVEDSDSAVEITPTDTEATLESPTATAAEAAVEARIIEEQAPEMEAQVAAEDSLPTTEEMSPPKAASERRGRGRPRKSMAAGDAGEAPKPHAPRKPRAVRAPRAEKSASDVGTNPTAESTITPMDVSGTAVSSEPETERQADTTWSPSSDALTATDENNIVSESQDRSGE